MMADVNFVRGQPDPLHRIDGRRIEDGDAWRSERREEIVELFREHVYGRAPGRPDDSHFQVKDESIAMNGAAIRRRIDIRFSGPGGSYSIPLLLFIPTSGAGPYPVLLLLNNRERWHTDPEREKLSGFWPAERIVERGYAAAAVEVADIDPDEHDGFLNGVHGVFEPEPSKRAPDAWGTIAAWAWGASRAMDYFATCAAELDADRVVVVGHSRGGKTALWAGATDERFAMVVSNNSGSTGAALSRGKGGETIRDINERFPHWFNDNYKAYNGREHALPLDQHLLLASIAPRHLYVTSATEDDWADPVSEYASLRLASPVYRLLGKPGFEPSSAAGSRPEEAAAPLPQPDTPLHTDGMAYHLRTGAHDLTPYDWEQFMDYADRYLPSRTNLE